MNLQELKSYCTFKYVNKYGGDIPYKTAVMVTRHLLERAIRRILPNKPIVLLSGGVDSSTTLALVSKHLRARTLTVAFEGQNMNDLQPAREIAEYYESEHEEMIIPKLEVKKELPTIVAMFDKPIAETGMIAIYFVAKRLQNETHSILTGDGGDELFLGYNWHKLYYFPIPYLRDLVYNYMISSTWKRNVPFRDFEDYELKTHLVHNHLYVANTIGKHFDLEFRSPFLDMEVMNFVYNLPVKYKMTLFRNKKLLRDAMGDMPNRNRPKYHFQTPAVADTAEETRRIMLELWLKSHESTQMTLE